MWTGRGYSSRGRRPTYSGSGPRLAYQKNDKRPAPPTANKVVVGHFRLRTLRPGNEAVPLVQIRTVW